MVKAGPKRRRAKEEEAKALAIAENSRKLANGSRRASKVREYNYPVRKRIVKRKSTSLLNPFQPSNSKGLSPLAQFMETRPADVAPIDWYRSWVGHAYRKRDEELSELAKEIIETVGVLVKMKMDTTTADICDMLDANPRSIAGVARHLEYRGYIVRTPTGWKEVSLG